MKEEDLVARLREIGLTGYEAKCYISLVSLGPSDPRKVARHAGIPHPNAYESISRLVRTGWVELVRKRPALYRARRPRVIEEQIISEMDELFGNLERLYKTVPAVDAELVYTIRDPRNVSSKIHELMSGARDMVMMVGPWSSISELRLDRLLRQIIDEGVDVRVVTDSSQNYLPRGVHVKLGNPVAFDLLVDGRVALIALPDFSACGWIDSPAVATHLMQFLELLWQNSANVQTQPKA